MKIFPLNSRLIGFCLGAFVALSAAAQQDFESQAGNRVQAPGEPRNRARVHTELGAAYFQSGHMSAALDELRIALSADSSYVQAYSVRGLVYAQLKEYAKAEDDFRRALDIAPGDPEVNNNYGWYLCDTGKEKQSIPYFLQALKNPLYETPDRAYANAGACALKAGDLEGAQNYLLNALRFSRDGALAARVQLAKLFYLRGNNSEAKIYLNEVLKMMDQPTAEVLWLGVRLERRLGNRSTEGAYAAQLRSRFPTSLEYQEFLKGNFQ
ncbi:MAG: type IV pilus biogenesis/stability protein PilW [Rhodocyclales bacterium GT-UBC]|nr:MAG: type IV pilus biogenesis/stability protein PilW [Rhodocyclales bacterium GT-UBC]